MNERPIEELLAGDKFRESVKPKADGILHGGPGWCGWVIMDAFLAGIDYERNKGDPEKVERNKKRQKLWEGMKAVASKCIEQVVPGKTLDDQMDIMLDALDALRSFQRSEDELQEYRDAEIIRTFDELDRQFHRRKHRAEKANQVVNEMAELFQKEMDK